MEKSKTTKLILLDSLLQEKTKMTTQDKSGATKVDLGLLEEDDEFEEFPAHELGRTETEEEKDMNVWEDNWDDDVVEDDFSNQLRAELQSQSSKMDH
jgi:26 proteasome complex subunit DSS1